MRIVAAALLALALAACGGSESEFDPTPPVADDIQLLVERIDALHPDPWHAISEADFREAADELAARSGPLDFNQLLVELMRLTALLGERDGHSGVFPLDDHARRLHLLPIRLYEFSDGFFVVGSIAQPELVGSRLTSIGGRPVDEVAQTVRSLVPADNEWSAKARIPQYMIVAEVLDGLGIAPELELDGRAVELEPVTADEYAAAFADLFHPMVPQGLPERPDPPYLARRLEDRWSARLPGALYAAYNVMLGDPGDLARAIRRTGAPVVVDLRHNPGGDNFTYAPVLEALRGRDVIALIGRTTFSAAGNFITELELRSNAVFVGEPSGGAPNQYGDPVAVEVRAAGVTAQVASVYWRKSTPDDDRLAIEPSVPVELSSRDFFSGRDPVLRAALRRALR